MLKQHQFEDRIDRFKNELEKFKQNKGRVEGFRKLADQGYDKRAVESKEPQIIEDGGSKLLFLDGEGNLHNSSSKHLHKMFLPQGANYSGPDLRAEIEQKVRQLLGRTELKEIAGSAKVLVEISDHT